MNPDNNHWDSDFAREELEHLAKELGVKITETGKTRLDLTKLRARDSRALFLYYNLRGGENNGFIRPR